MPWNHKEKAKRDEETMSSPRDLFHLIEDLDLEYEPSISKRGGRRNMQPGTRIARPQWREGGERRSLLTPEAHDERMIYPYDGCRAKRGDRQLKRKVTENKVFAKLLDGCERWIRAVRRKYGSFVPEIRFQEGNFCFLKTISSCSSANAFLFFLAGFFCSF